jgi:DNA-binding CsgD family transcriptional regulator
MHPRPEEALAVLSRLDADRRRGSSRPLSVRDGALLALAAIGLSSSEIAALSAAAVTMAAGRVVVTVQRRGGPWSRVLRPALARRLVDWLTENRLWAEAERVFSSEKGALTSGAIRKVLARHIRPDRPGRRALRSARPSGKRPGPPEAAINPLELLTLWEGRGGRRPLPLYELAARLGVSPNTLRKHLRALRAAGQVDDETRARNLAARGRDRIGGRRPRPITADALTAAWARKPTVTAVARTLHVSRTRVRARLQELGLLPSNDERTG